MNHGLSNEIEIIECINNKKYCEISSAFLKETLLKMFKNINDSDLFVCEKIKGTPKTDIYITKIENNNAITKYVSIKMGDSNSIHQENVFEFCKFLKSIGVSNESIKTLLFYHFGDKTLDGSGSKIFDLDYIKLNYSFEIKKMNDEINKKEILYKVINRTLIKNKNDSHEIDYLLFGNTQYGYLISKEDLLIFLTRSYYSYITTPHFGPFIYQAYSRFSSDYKRRAYMQLKWKSIFLDIQRICNKKA